MGQSEEAGEAGDVRGSAFAQVGARLGCDAAGDRRQSRQLGVGCDNAEQPDHDAPGAVEQLAARGAPIRSGQRDRPGGRIAGMSDSSTGRVPAATV